MHGEWLCKPATNTAVVFVHGILSSGEKCWQCDNGAYWPALLRRETDLNGLGIYVYSYRTDIFSGHYQLGDVVDDLKERMRLDGMLQNQRLIFVCHSMGGIVARQYLVTRALDLIEAKAHVGLFLVGSPSLGSEYANWFGLFVNIFGNSQAEALRFAQDNAWLNDLDKNFRNLQVAGKLPLSGKELVEDNFIILKKFFRKQVVEPFSGARYFGEPYKVPHSDHFSIAKPENEQAIQHRLLVQFCKEMLQTEVPAKAASPAHEPAFSPHSLNLSTQGDLTARDVVGGNKIVDRSISVGDLQNVSGVAIGEKASVTIIQQAALPAFQPLHQLPTPPADFTGREAELNELMAKMETGGVTISGLQGMGGIGKTALALKLAELLTPRYSDAQFFLDLKGASDKPLLPAEAMAHVIRAYHPTAKLPESEAELKPLYQSVSHGQRALLLMDNARDAQQVQPLLPPATCLLLVTSRQHFTLPGLFAKNLDILPPEDAHKLLFSIAPRIGEQAEAIAKLCGHLPLALRLAGSVLAERIDLSPVDYARRLINAHTRFERVDASLSLGYELLDVPMQQRWRMLAVFPDTFDQTAAAAVWNSDLDQAQDTLSTLVAYSLVEWKPATSRYHLHDLVRLFADSRCAEEERFASQQRHAQHYEIILRRANEFYEKGGDFFQRGLALFDLEWSNIQFGHAWAIANTENDKAATVLCSDYPDAGRNLLLMRHHPRERIRWLDAALVAARHIKQIKSEGVHLVNLGIAYNELGEIHLSIKLYQEALIILREIGDRRREGIALNNLGFAFDNLGETNKAIECYEKCLSIFREINDHHGESNVLGNLGIAYKNLGKPHRAIEFYQQELVIAREIGNRHVEGATLGNLGVAYAALGETDRAIEFYEKALIIARDIGDRRREGSALWNKSLALEELGEHQKAIVYAEAALKIREQLEDPRAAIVRRQLDEWREIKSKVKRKDVRSKA